MLDWPSAKASCENDGAGLVTFPSAVQSQLFGDYLFSDSMSQNTLFIDKIFPVTIEAGANPLTILR